MRRGRLKLRQLLIFAQHAPDSLNLVALADAFAERQTSPMKCLRDTDGVSGWARVGCGVVQMFVVLLTLCRLESNLGPYLEREQKSISFLVEVGTSNLS